MAGRSSIFVRKHSDLLIALDDHVRRYNYFSSTCSTGLLIMICVLSAHGLARRALCGKLFESRAGRTRYAPDLRIWKPKATYVAPTDGVICVFQVRGVPQRSLSRPQYRAPKAESLQGTAKIRHHVFQGICGATPRITMPFSSSYTDYGRLKYSCNESDITRRSQLRCYTMIPIKADIL